jgi:hypothetical protein
MDKKEKAIYDRFGLWGISKVRRACLSYNGKVNQVHELFEFFGRDSLKIIEYEKLVMYPEKILSDIYSFIELKFDSKYAEVIHSKSLNKKIKLPKHIYSMVYEICEPVFLESKKLI